MSESRAQELLGQVHEDWTLGSDGLSISRFFEFKTFSRTMSFVNAVAFVATNEGHHPQMTVNYGNCVVDYSTHAIDGLSDNDFICAAKIDRMAEEL